jgi:hypothetical protein
MIVREIAQYRVLDSTTNTLTDRPLDYRLILAPLIDWRLMLLEHRIVLVEPQSGSVGAPEPNAFMVIVPPSFAINQVFGIQLLETDWESEGFAVGDEVAMAMGPVTSNSIFLRAIIQGISGQIATFRISSTPTIVGTLNTQNPFPLVAFLDNERFNIRYALLRAGDVGFVSPLNGQPFYVAGHANHIELLTYAITNSTSRYNLRLYNATQEANIDLRLPNARNLKAVTIEISGTQFYAYRSSLNTTSNSPSQAYPTRGKIVLEGKAPNDLRNISFEAECLLLHPNRIEETNSFVAPGTLTITGGSALISAPSIPSPVRQMVCLLGPDSHHSLPSVFRSLDLTAPTPPPAIPPPRPGADYVGVVTGQVSGQWVAVMTNRVASTEPTYNLNITIPNPNLARYDCIVLETNEVSARLPGTYTVIIYGKIRGTFVPLASYDLNITTASPNPVPELPYTPFTYGTVALGNLFPFGHTISASLHAKTATYDSVFITNDPILGDKSLFFVPIPSGTEPPPIGALTSPDSGYLLDLWPFLDHPKTLKVHLICPNGDILASAPKVFDTPRADRQLATITRSGNLIQVTLNNEPVIVDSGIEIMTVRAALFPWPAGHTPIYQGFAFRFYDYSTGGGDGRIDDTASPILVHTSDLYGYSYTIWCRAGNLPPGNYALHVRSEYEHPTYTDYESFFYLFSIRNPIEPAGNPLPLVRCRIETPAVRGEPWPYIVLRDDVIEKRETALNTCKIDDYCSCFTFVSAIPEDWVDIIGFFEGAVLGRPIPTGAPTARHKVRLRGRIIRVDDEYSTESFVSSVYREEDIVRSYAPRYQLELIAQAPCDLSHIDILKLAAHWTVINRSNRMLPQQIPFLRPAEIALSDSGEHTKVTITLKPLRWRDEYRRQG